MMSCQVCELVKHHQGDSFACSQHVDPPRAPEASLDSRALCACGLCYCGEIKGPSVCCILQARVVHRLSGFPCFSLCFCTDGVTVH